MNVQEKMAQLLAEVDLVLTPKQIYTVLAAVGSVAFYEEMDMDQVCEYWFELGQREYVQPTYPGAPILNGADLTATVLHDYQSYEERVA
jgi:hypothetical protein